MKINGRNFDGSSTLLESNRSLRSLAGNISGFTEFQPIPCPKRDIFELLLLKLFQLNICCHLSGSFVTWTAGVFHSYMAATLYVAVTDIPIVNIIFQKGPIEIGHFSLDVFHFHLVKAEPHLDACCYHISKGNFSTSLIVFGIDTSPLCTPSSNVDFVHFVWQHFEHFNFKKYSITPLPSEDGSVPKLCLKNHRTESDGWGDNVRCLTCRLDYRRIMHFFTNCILPASCSCNICVRQPPSLLPSASHVVFNHIFNLEQFELTGDTT